MERDEIERDAEGAQMDEAKALYEETFINVAEQDRPSFLEWVAEIKSQE